MGIIIIATISIIAVLAIAVYRLRERPQAAPAGSIWMFHAQLLINELAELRGGKTPCPRGTTVSYILSCLDVDADVRDDDIQQRVDTRLYLAQRLESAAEFCGDADKAKFFRNLAALLRPDKWDAA